MSTTIATTPASIMDSLKAQTAEHHQSAERHPFQRALFSGTLPRGLYAASLGQMLLVHRALAPCLSALAARDPRARAVIREHQFHESDFAADLQHFGAVPATVSALPATGDLIREMTDLATSRPLAVLGMHYVLEGSTNGGVYIAKGVRRAYNLQGTTGTRSLDPYGERQRERWAEFKASMNAAEFTPQESRDLVDGAQWMFEAVSRLGSAVLASAAPD